MTYSLAETEPGNSQDVTFEAFRPGISAYPDILVLPGSQDTARGPQADAIQDILDVVEVRAATYFGVNFFRTKFGSLHQAEAARVQQEYLAAASLQDRFDIFYACMDAKAADLGMLKNNGKWLSKETEAVEVQIARIADAFQAAGMSSGMIDPMTEEAKVAFYVVSGMTRAEEADKVNLRHRRTLFQTRPQLVTLTDPATSKKSDMWRVVSVDKLAEHSLDLVELKANHGTNKAATALFECAARGQGVLEVSPRARRFLYHAIDDATDERLVSRAATIYYVENKLLTEQEALAFA